MKVEMFPVGEHLRDAADSVGPSAPADTGPAGATAPGVDGPQPDDLGLGILFWSTRDAVVVEDVTSGRVVLWNPAAEELFGYSATEAVGQSIGLLMLEDATERPRTGVDRRRNPGHDVPVGNGTREELRAMRKDGEVIRVELSRAQLEATGHHGPFVLAIIRDVTERVRLENALRAARAVQHELNNQLTLAVGYTELLVHDPALPEDLREAVLEAQRGATLAAQTVTRLQRITLLDEADQGNAGTLAGFNRSAS